MAVTAAPPWARVCAACRPVRTLTSCSGEHPPKMTPGELTTPILSWEVVGEVVFVQDHVAWAQVAAAPRHRLGAGGEAKQLGPASAPLGSSPAGQQGAGVGVAHHQQVGGLAGGLFA